jgi:hypothetical protein
MLSIPTVANSLWATHFALTDRLRRAQGDALDALGLGPRECQFQVICSGPHWRLRAYGGPDAGPVLLMEHMQKRAAEEAVQKEALHVVERWNAERSPLWSPTIRCHHRRNAVARCLLSRLPDLPSDRHPHY